MSRRLCLLLFTSLYCTVCSANWAEVEAKSSDEQVARKLVLDAVAAAIARRDFAGLDAMADEFRAKRSRSASGTWHLSTFYGGAFFYAPEVRANPACPQPDNGFVDDWIAASPAQPAAYIVKARLLQNNAFCRRGTASAATTSDAQMDGFAQQIDRALALLADHRELVAKDPQFYAETIRLYRARGIDRDAMTAVMEQGIAQEPYFYEIYMAATEYFQPHWMGVPGDQDRLGRWAVQHTPLDKNGTYARVMWYLDHCKCLPRAEIDWPMMVQAMDDLAARYPTDWNRANFARLACKFQDYATAKRHLDAMKQDSGDAWDSEQEWTWCTANVSMIRG